MILRSVADKFVLLHILWLKKNYKKLTVSCKFFVVNEKITALLLCIHAQTIF